MNNKRKNSGFTLIELVVVVAIIGVLASIITPRIRTSLMKAKDAKVVASLDALRTAANVYYAEKGVVPFIVNTGGADATALAALTNTSVAPINVGNIAQLVRNGYLDRTSAIKLLPSGVTTANLDTLIAAAPGSAASANATAISSSAVTVQNGTAGGTNCTAVGVTANDPDYTQGFITFGWETDGIGIKILKSAGLDSGTPALVADTDANTNCELWSSK